MISQEEYGSEFREHLLQQYILMRETITTSDNVRGSHMRLIYGLVAGMVAGLFYALLSLSSPGDNSPTFWIVGLACTLISSLGTVFCAISWRLLIGFRVVLEEKYKILKEYELYLPDRMFFREWNSRNNGNYINISSTLILFSKIFTFSFAIFFILSIIFTVSTL